MFDIRTIQERLDLRSDELGSRPRKLTTREAARVLGFPENILNSSVSSAQVYKQFGNSVAVPVIDAIARQMLPTLGVRIKEHSGLWPT